VNTFDTALPQCKLVAGFHCGPYWSSVNPGLYSDIKIILAKSRWTRRYCPASLTIYIFRSTHVSTSNGARKRDFCVCIVCQKYLVVLSARSLASDALERQLSRQNGTKTRLESVFISEVFSGMKNSIHAVGKKPVAWIR